MEDQYLDDFCHWLSIRGITTEEMQIFSHSGFRAGTPKNLTASMMSVMIKEVAESEGLDARNYSNISMRKGATTSMGLSGRSELECLAITGHAHIETSAIYNKPSGSIGNVFANAFVITTKDVRRAVPVANRMAPVMKQTGGK